MSEPGFSGIAIICGIGTKRIDLTNSYKIYNDAAIGVSGYVKTDVTGDNFVDLSDLTLTFNNSNLFAVIRKP